MTVSAIWNRGTTSQQRPFSDLFGSERGSVHKARGSGDILLVYWIQGSFRAVNYMLRGRLEHPQVETTADQGSGAWRSQLMASSRDVKNRVGQAKD